jgi:predicted dithiol-disulfide oxidoreductase (DUF899 family)
METHAVVSRKEWIAARRALLIREKELTRAHDQVSAERRELPWVNVEEPYLFEGPDGRETLADLFGGRSQLIVYHFMFGPGWTEGCTGCSFVADHIDGANLHLQHHDVSLVAVSRAPWREFQDFKTRMGWRFKWVSSHGTDFNYDYGVSFTKEQVATGDVGYNYGTSPVAHDELHGVSVFYKDPDGAVFHTYSSYARGCDILLGAHNYLDLTPKGRNETGTMDWVRHHDRYGGVAVDPRHSQPADGADTCCACGTEERVA